MPKLGIKGQPARRIEAIIEIARLMVRAGHNPKIIQRTLIDPIIEVVEIRIEYGVSTSKEEDK
jgi:hypothetical protein